ncbi:MAG: hypothetical protein H7X95_03705 [Deltaproteobacteria bacterium]|nr:hypothetical protein [Deltaproteobacteria bacterium]
MKHIGRSSYDWCSATLPITGLVLGLTLTAACSGGSGQGGTGGRAGTGGNSGTGGAISTGTGGSINTGTGGATNTGSGGAITSSGGNTASGGNGNGGATGGATTSTGGGGPGGSMGATGGGGGNGGMAPACPANATFCSSFEGGATLPPGAVYKVNAAPGDWSRDFALDSTVSKSGRTSLRIKNSADAGTSGSAYRMLAVPAPMAVFWVRFYIQSDIPLGGQHNPFAAASGSDNPNDPVIMEFAEDVGIAFNYRDSVVRPDGYSFTNPFILPKDTWHCVEVSFDSQTRNQKLFINNVPLINVTNFPAVSLASTPFQVFKFGFNELHGPARKLWYDDVVVAPQRIPCL